MKNHNLDPFQFPLAKLAPAPRNPNKMSEERYIALREEMRVAGFFQPILVRDIGVADSYEILDGHHRVRAAQELGYTELPCVLLNVTDAEANALRIGLSRLRGEPDMATVAALLGSIDLDLHVPLTGLTDEEVSALTRTHDDLEDALEQASSKGMDADDESARDKPHVLELRYPTGEALNAIKRKLRKAAGKGGTLEQGLAALCGVEET